MSMFRFWTTDARGSETTTTKGEQPETPVSSTPASLATSAPTDASAPRHPGKRRRPSVADVDTKCRSTKRFKTEQYGGLPSPTSASAEGDEYMMMPPPPASPSADEVALDQAREVIQYQFGLEILLKHDELRLIDQELAKCQVALEQLRRCHLVPYPVNCPTPDQMLNISSGKGPALAAAPGETLSNWAPPFGVVEGPYARHYAKWLIPDPMFDGIVPETPSLTDAGRARTSVAEGRTTRNSMSEAGGGLSKRAGRGAAGHKLQALSSGYLPAKDKHSPCTVRKSDGQVVKLVCIDCRRWDFSSTQGFINHCRIAHKRDYKSHEEAAIHCGHPIEVDESGVIVGDDQPSAAPGSGLVHPFARAEAPTEQQLYAKLLSRIEASLKLYHAGKLPHITSIPGAPAPKASSSAPTPTPAPARSDFVDSPTTPYLSRLMQMKKVGNDLREHVHDATIKVDLDDMFDDETDEDDCSGVEGPASPVKPLPGTARTPIVMRVPARTASSPPPKIQAAGGPEGSQDVTHRLPHLPSSSAVDSFAKVIQGDEAESPSYNDMDVDLSPNVATSNRAPSLVSDDSEYDSDDRSTETSEGVDAESVSDVAEISVDDENVAHHHHQAMHHRSGSMSTGVNFKKNDGKHVTFVTPISNAKQNAKGRQKKNV